MPSLCKFVDEHAINVLRKRGIGVERTPITDVFFFDLLLVWVWARAWVCVWSDKLGNTTHVCQPIPTTIHNCPQPILSNRSGRGRPLINSGSRRGNFRRTNGN